MNDFDYDAMQKKRIASSARHRVCGSKSRRCGLPHDNLTPAQIRAMSGDPVTYALNRLMDYETFKSMPTDLQQTYLDGLHDRFGVALTHISFDLFGKSKSTLEFYAKTAGLKRFGRGGRRMTENERDAWLRWIRQEAAEEPAESCDEIAEEIAEYVEEIEEIAEEQDPLQVSELSATFTGKFDPERFLKWVAMLPMPEGKVKIRVEVSEA